MFGDLLNDAVDLRNETQSMNILFRPIQQLDEETRVMRRKTRGRLVSEEQQQRSRSNSIEQQRSRSASLLGMNNNSNINNNSLLKRSQSIQAPQPTSSIYLSEYTSKAKEALNSLDLRQQLTPLEPLKTYDIDGFLRHEHMLLRVAILEECLVTTKNSFERQFVQFIQQDWQENRARILSQKEEIDFRTPKKIT